jgi:hypothetical protein
LYNDYKHTGADSKGRKHTYASTGAKTAKPKAAVKSSREAEIEKLKNNLDCKLEGLKNKELSALTEKISKVKGVKNKVLHIELEALLIPIKKVLHISTSEWLKEKEVALGADKIKNIAALEAQLDNKTTNAKYEDATNFKDSAFPSYRELGTGIAVTAILSIIAMISFANTFIIVGLYNYTAYPIAFVLSLAMAIIFFFFGGKYRYRESAFRQKKYKGNSITTWILLPGLASIVSVVGIVSYTFTSSPDQFNIWSFLMTFLVLCAGIFVAGYFLIPPPDLTGNIKRIKSIESDKDTLRKKIKEMKEINPTDESRVHYEKYIEYTVQTETLLEELYKRVAVLKEDSIAQFRPAATDLANFIMISELSVRPEGRLLEDDDPEIEETVTTSRETSIEAFNKAVKKKIDAELDNTAVRVAFDKTITDTFDGIRKIKVTTNPEGEEGDEKNL